MKEKIIKELSQLAQSLPVINNKKIATDRIYRLLTTLARYEIDNASQLSDFNFILSLVKEYEITEPLQDILKLISINYASIFISEVKRITKSKTYDEKTIDFFIMHASEIEQYVSFFDQKTKAQFLFSASNIYNKKLIFIDKNSLESIDTASKVFQLIKEACELDPFYYQSLNYLCNCIAKKLKIFIGIVRINLDDSIKVNKLLLEILKVLKEPIDDVLHSLSSLYIKLKIQEKNSKDELKFAILAKDYAQEANRINNKHEEQYLVTLEDYATLLKITDPKEAYSIFETILEISNQNKKYDHILKHVYLEMGCIRFRLSHVAEGEEIQISEIQKSIELLRTSMSIPEPNSVSNRNLRMSACHMLVTALENLGRVYESVKPKADLKNAEKSYLLALDYAKDNQEPRKQGKIEHQLSEFYRYHFKDIKLTLRYRLAACKHILIDLQTRCLDKPSDCNMYEDIKSKIASLSTDSKDHILYEIDTECKNFIKKLIDCGDEAAKKEGNFSDNKRKRLLGEEHRFDFGASSVKSMQRTDNKKIRHMHEASQNIGALSSSRPQ